MHQQIPESVPGTAIQTILDKPWATSFRQQLAHRRPGCSSLRPRSHGIIIGLQGQANSFSGAKAARIATMTKCAEKANNDTVTDSLYGFEYSYDTTNLPNVTRGNG